MDTERTEKLIAVVKSKPIIWDLKHPKYTSNKKKVEAWNYVSGATGISVNNAKKKWKGLRDSYIRELHRLEKYSDQSADETNNSWKYTKSMDFLKAQVRPKNGDFKYNPNNEDGFDESADDISTKPCKGVEEVWPFNSLPCKQDFDFMDESSRLSPPLSKKCKPNEDQSLLSTMKSIQDMLIQSSQTKLEQSLNFEDDLFCRSLGEKISTFPLKKKNEVKIEMLRYLCEIEEELTMTSN